MINSVRIHIVDDPFILNGMTNSRHENVNLFHKYKNVEQTQGMKMSKPSGHDGVRTSTWLLIESFLRRKKRVLKPHHKCNHPMHYFPSFLLMIISKLQAK